MADIHAMLAAADQGVAVEFGVEAVREVARDRDEAFALLRRFLRVFDAAAGDSSGSKPPVTLRMVPSLAHSFDIPLAETAALLAGGAPAAAAVRTRQAAELAAWRDWWTAEGHAYWVAGWNEGPTIGIAKLRRAQEAVGAILAQTDEPRYEKA